MTTGKVVPPVDEDQRGQDHVSREEVVRISKEAGASNRPDLPVEAIRIDITADLIAFVGIGLRESICQFVH